jgi:hypothetical protein
MNAALLYYDNGLVMQYIHRDLNSELRLREKEVVDPIFWADVFYSWLERQAGTACTPGASPTGLVAVQKNGSFWSFLARISPYFFTKLEDLP